MKRFLITLVTLVATLSMYAQGNNTLMGGNDDNIQSIAERVTKLEKKHDALNLYINFSASVRSEHNSLTDEWSSRFANRQLRIEMKGNITDRLFYRLRHCLNRPTEGKSLDNFAKATDIMMVGYKVSDKVTLAGGKLAQIWGGYEFDENPIYVYEYSDVVNNMGDFLAGAMVSYHPTPTQELAFEVSNTYWDKFGEVYGANPLVLDKGTTATLKKAAAPFTYILNWNGSLFGGVITTRWACGVQTQARGKYSRMVTLGQQLNLPRFQCYLDYMAAFDDLDQLGIATTELAQPLAQYGSNVHLGKINYQTLVAKANWQFAPSWNLMLKGMYGITSVRNNELYRNYRRNFGYVGSVEYFPVKHQDFRLFLSYTGRKNNYTRKCELTDYNTDRVELGLIYRLKVY